MVEGKVFGFCKIVAPLEKKYGRTALFGNFYRVVRGACIDDDDLMGDRLDTFEPCGNIFCFIFGNDAGRNLNYLAPLLLEAS